MHFSYYITKIAERFYYVGNGFLVTGANIAGVYLIGGALSGLFFEVGSRFIGVGIDLYNAGSQFDEFYNQVRSGISGNPILQQLIEWAGELINFISNRDNFIINLVRSVFGGIDAILRNTYSYILPHVLQIIYDRFAFMRDINTHIINFLGTLIPSFSILRSNPVQWIIDRLKIYSLALGRFINDPDGYIKEKLYAFFPDLRLFLENPTEYIMMKLGDKLEIFVERYLSRLIKIVESAINNIF